MQGLNKDGGISFERKRNFDSKKKEPEMFSRKVPDKPDEELKKDSWKRVIKGGVGEALDLVSKKDLVKKKKK